MNIESFVKDWLAAANAFDTTRFLEKWHKNAVLDDPSVGQKFKGHPGIRSYFEDYFIGYKTQTKLVKLDPISDKEAHLTVHFTGEFPGGQIGGTFDLVFKDEKILKAKADLI